MALDDSEHQACSDHPYRVLRSEHAGHPSP